MKVNSFTIYFIPKNNIKISEMSDKLYKWLLLQEGNKIYEIRLGFLSLDIIKNLRTFLGERLGEKLCQGLTNHKEFKNKDLY